MQKLNQPVGGGNKEVSRVRHVGVQPHRGVLCVVGTTTNFSFLTCELKDGLAVCDPSFRIWIESKSLANICETLWGTISFPPLSPYFQLVGVMFCCFSRVECRCLCKPQHVILLTPAAALLPSDPHCALRHQQWDGRVCLICLNWSRRVELRKLLSHQQ